MLSHMYFYVLIIIIVYCNKRNILQYTLSAGLEPTTYRLTVCHSTN